jgi:hypothetical protein
VDFEEKGFKERTGKSDVTTNLMQSLIAEGDQYRQKRNPRERLTDLVLPLSSEAEPQLRPLPQLRGFEP